MAADIQIILPSTTLLVNENFLFDVINILEADHDISLLGVRGAAYMPLSGRWQDSDEIYGSVYEMQQDGEIKEYQYIITNNKYELVHCIDDTSLIQAGLPSGMYFYENEFFNAQASELANCLGYKIAVAISKHPWCVVLDKEKAVDDGIRLVEYANYLLNDKIILGRTKDFLLMAGTPV